MNIQISQKFTAEKGQTNHPFTCKANAKGTATMTKKMTSPSSRGKCFSAAGLTLLSALAWMAFPAKAQTPTMWQPYGMPLHIMQQQTGQVINKMDTSNQVMTSNMTLTVYKAPPSTDQYDYYLVAGPFSHSVTSGTNNGNGTGWSTYTVHASDGTLSDEGFGWCGSAMNLSIAGSPVISGAWVQIPQAKPDSTQDLTSATTSLSFGSGGIGIDYSVSTAAPDVSISTNFSDSGVIYQAGLNCGAPTWSSDASPSPTSKYGTTLQVAVLYQVAHGAGLILNWNNDVWWQFADKHWTEDSEGDSGAAKIITTSDNLYSVGAVVADFGTAPLLDSNGKVIQRAVGHQLVDQYSGCLTAPGSSSHLVSAQVCVADSSDAQGNIPNALRAQQWYYTANSQLVNVLTGTCLDISGGFPQGGTPQSGASLILNPCTPALATASCTGTCVAPRIFSQQWQLAGQPTSSQQTISPLIMTSSSGAFVSVDPISSKVTVQNTNLNYPMPFTIR